MSEDYQIKTNVQFTEHTAIPKEQSESVLFDILVEEVIDNATYCRVLINKLLAVPYAQLADFINHHTQFISDPIKWLNKTDKLISVNEKVFSTSDNQGRMMKCFTIIESKRKELEILRNRHTKTKPPMQYINAECEERYFCFREVKNTVNAMDCNTDKIMFLTKEKFDYEQASIDFINPKLPDYSIQCQKEIDQIQHLIRLTDEFSKEQMQKNSNGLPFNKLKINCNINQLVDIFYQLHRELFVDGKPIIDGNVNDIASVIVNSFTDRDGRDLSPESVKTMLTPSKTDKRPKPHKRIDIDKLL
ncbi:hypothetical protein [Epilithonimonas xixisoli]|uniref:Uncharacterized protein n=1 Tax=Epilithonimonas xixisoli TaxID=1476462 RepID=A0A4R8IC54_9FLAO|nr:hypothetical protein [Epilithonimonas xixisoli]TDX87304.1 hypothetical protein B0I22_1492 [Epilithonimonas xixisoli]